MTIRLTTPGVIAAAVLALLIGIVLAYEVNQARAPQYVGIRPEGRAGVSTALGAFNPSVIFQNRVAGVVVIQAIVGDPTEPLQGTGFVIDNDGHIITNYHVIRDTKNGSGRATQIFIENHSTGDTTTATLVGYDAYNDIAVLKVNPEGMNLKPIPWGTSDALVTGEPVGTIGAPFNRANSISMGIVSAKDRTTFSGVAEGYDIPGAIQTTVTTNLGNSGGPLLNSRGEIVGVVQQIGTNPNEDAGESTVYDTGISFAIPAELVRKSVEQILDHGFVKLPRIGLNGLETVSPGLARYANLPSGRGVLVGEVSGPALDAGISAGRRSVVYDGGTIQLGDQIVEIAGTKVTTADMLAKIVSRLEVGRAVNIKLYHNGKLQTVSVTPVAR